MLKAGRELLNIEQIPKNKNKMTQATEAK